MPRDINCYCESNSRQHCPVHKHEKPGRHIMLDNLVAGITDHELEYLIQRIGVSRVTRMIARLDSSPEPPAY